MKTSLNKFLNETSDLSIKPFVYSLVAVAGVFAIYKLKEFKYFESE